MGVGLGVGLTEAVAAGEGDCAAVATGLGEGVKSRRTILSFADVAAAVLMCDLAFVVVFGPVGEVTAGLGFGEPTGVTVIPVAWLRLPICAPGFRCVPIFGTLGTVVPVRGIAVALLCPATVPVVAAVLLLTLLPVRGDCAKVNGIVATHITITLSLIDVIRFIGGSLRQVALCFDLSRIP